MAVLVGVGGVGGFSTFDNTSNSSMPLIFFAFFFFFSLTSFSQDEILGEWHLKLIHNDGVEFFNYYGSGIVFSETETSINFQGSSICNAIVGEFIYTGNNTLLRSNFAITGKFK